MVEIFPSCGKISTMFKRIVTPKRLEALSDTPVILMR